MELEEGDLNILSGSLEARHLSMDGFQIPCLPFSDPERVRGLGRLDASLPYTGFLWVGTPKWWCSF